MIPQEIADEIEDACSDLREHIEKDLVRYVSDFGTDAEVVLVALMRVIGGIIMDAPDHETREGAIRGIEMIVADIKDHARAGHA